MKLRKRLRVNLRLLRNFVVYRIIHVDDTPHRIALGVAIGMFVAWTPTSGMQMVLIVALSALCRANKVVGVPMAWLSNPATLWVNVLCYVLGCKMLGLAHNEAAFWAALKDAISGGHGLIGGTVHFFQAIGGVFWPLLLGSLVFSAVLGALTYFATYYAVRFFRRRRAAHHRKILLADAAQHPTGPEAK
ncbi:MAG: DUF2062 domain-containing protein [Phycisphaerae bacterium]|jgi:hypothetical protein